jgi:type VI secretion system protein ImpG
MNREFLDLYNRELQVLHEQAREFAIEYPGIAERLGGLLTERMDPMVAGLLEGTAFLAARVQLKLKHEFPEFTSNLLEQLVPNYLAPTPSVMLAKIMPAFADPALRDGRPIPRGAYLDATYRQLDRNVACRYRLCASTTLWPFDIVGAEYLTTPAALHALGLSVGPDAASGLRLSLTHRTGAPEGEGSAPDAIRDPATWFAGCRLDELRLHLVGDEADAVALYEQLFGDCVGIFFRFLDEFGDPVIVPAPEGCLSQIGFEDDETLFPNDERIFRGFDFVREYFLFPPKFLGFELTRLSAVMPRLPTQSVDVLFTFNKANGRLAAAVRADMFALYAAPAINLFEKSTDRIEVKNNKHEYHVVPDRSRYLDFEPHQILEVYAHYPGARDKVPVRPLYSGSVGSGTADPGLSYTVRRVPRRRTARERVHGLSSDYTGTDMFISLVEPARIDDEGGVAELSVRALCSNRHLTEHLPVGEGGADFRLLDDAALDVVCLVGPTPPHEPVVSRSSGRSETASAGTVTWRLVNMLSLNHLGLVERGAGRNGQSLQEVLCMFADLADGATERRIRGIRGVRSRPVVRRVSLRGGSAFARGTEITVTADERSFEGTGLFLLGAVLDRLFAEYSAMNHFTQTVIRSIDRGEIKRWPPRTGSRRPL